MTTDLQRAVTASVIARWRDRHAFYRAASNGERVTLASLYRAGVLERRCWRGTDGAANAAYEYRPSSNLLTEIARNSGEQTTAALMPVHAESAAVVPVAPRLRSPTGMRDHQLQTVHDKIAPLMEPTDRTLIANALRVAAEQYRRDAAEFVSSGIQRSADGFTAQAERAEELAAVIEL